MFSFAAEMSQTPELFSWLVTYWPILLGLGAIFRVAFTTNVKLDELVKWTKHHRHDEDGNPYLPGNAA